MALWYHERVKGRTAEEIVLELMKRKTLKKGIPLHRLYPEEFGALPKEVKALLELDKPVKKGRPRVRGEAMMPRLPSSKSERIATVAALERLIELKGVPLAERARIAEEKLRARGFDGYEALIAAKRIKRPRAIPPIVKYAIAKELVWRKDELVMETPWTGEEPENNADGPRIEAEGPPRASWKDCPPPERRLERINKGWVLQNRLDDVVTVMMENPNIDVAARKLGVTREELMNAQRDPDYQAKFYARFNELNAMRDLYIVQRAFEASEHLWRLLGNEDGKTPHAVQAAVGMKWVEWARAIDARETGEAKDRERLRELKASLEGKGRVDEVKGEVVKEEGEDGPG